MPLSASAYIIHARSPVVGGVSTALLWPLLKFGVEALVNGFILGCGVAVE